MSEFEKGRFRETCGICGAIFEVVVPGEFGRISKEEREDYACPECGHAYHCRGVAAPRVTLLSGRTDGG